MPASASRIFDQKHYLELIEARGETIRKIVPKLGSVLELCSSLDVGCGLGFFSQILSDCKLSVVGIDGRQTNVDEARQRYPKLTFETRDIEDSSAAGLGSFDLVLCFGLLYHLENPLRAIRHLKALTGKVLLLESMCIPGIEPFALLRDEPPIDDQSLTNLAFYPSEGCIVKMLYGCGFSSVYRVSPLPNHSDFRETSKQHRVRTVIVAAFSELSDPHLVRLELPREQAYPWAKPTSTGPGLLPRVRRFMKKPIRQKAAALLFSGLLNVPRPIRVPFGARWIPRDDHIGNPAKEGKFEAAELAFVEGFLKPGMTVLDIGAHHGLYSLLASKMVGPKGRVFSFEPSPRERKALRLNLALNWTRNVGVQGVALGSEVGQADFYLVEGNETGCNSLRPPNLKSGMCRRIRVQVSRLDDWLAQHKVKSVDFIKLDTEGAELDVLKGARRLLTTAPRPLLLVEVAEIRTAGWGYSAREILSFLEHLDYLWFVIRADGSLTALRPGHDLGDTNLIAVPKERQTPG